MRLARAGLLASLALASLALASLAAAPAAAQAFEDSATGFAVRPPAPFVAEAQQRRQFDVAAGLRSTTGVPPVAGTGEHVCVAGFKAAPQNAALTQAEINAYVAKPEWANVARAMFELTFHVDRLRRAPIGEVRGLEIEARPKAGPDHANARLYATLHETPKGRVTMVCSTTRAAWAKALPAFRALRAAMTLPK